jgi:sugar O-acyltransferase (sialic acid O-acetyltransferase NeuD family)
MKKILLIGGGGHCKSVIDVIEQEGKFQIAGLIDRPELLGNKTLQYKIIGNDQDLTSLAKQYTYAIVTVGQVSSPKLRINLFNRIKEAGFSIPCIVSPRAYVSSYASIAEGTVIMHDAVINASASVGENCIINTKAIIEHDVVIKDHCHVSTGAIVNGAAMIGEGSFVGSSATTKEAISVKANSFIKAGSVAK